MSDLISREYLLNKFKTQDCHEFVRLYYVSSIIDNAPTVEPHEDTGLWTIITVTKNNHIYGTCSNCGYQTYVNLYCGNCGSRNRLPKKFEARYL